MIIGGLTLPLPLLNSALVCQLSSQFAVRYWSFGDRRLGHWIRYVSRGLGGVRDTVGLPKRSMSYIPTPAVDFGDPASLHFWSHARARKEGRRRTGRRSTIEVLGEGRTMHRVLRIRSERKKGSASVCGEYEIDALRAAPT